MKYFSAKQMTLCLHTLSDIQVMEMLNDNVPQSADANFSSSTSNAFLACFSSSFIDNSSVQRLSFGKSFYTTMIRSGIEQYFSIYVWKDQTELEVG